MHRVINALLTLIFLCGSALVAQTPDLTVGEIKNPELKWGSQPISFEVTNNVDYLKFVVATVDLRFEGTYLNPKRRWKVNAIVPPLEPLIVTVPLDIPVNFGVAQIELTLYDVVDTLDPVAFGTRVMGQNFQLRFKIPDEISSYLQERITFPPMVDNNPMLDNEFTRVAFTMLAEGKTIPDIARLAKVDSLFVYRNIGELVTKKLVLRKQDAATLLFPFLTTKQAEKIKPLAEKASDQLAALMAENMPAYRRTLDSLIKAGTVAKDSSDFLNGGTVLYRPYPVIAALVLWADLGQKFVTDTALLDIYQETDPCNANVPRFMYAVQGGDVFNGHHYIGISSVTGHYTVHFGDRIAPVRCPDIYPFPTILSQGSDWSFDPQFSQEMFMIDTVVTMPVVRSVSAGSAPIVAAALDGLKKELDALGPNMFTLGSRLWFWNLTASRALDKMVAAGTLTRYGNGQYRMESMQ